MEYLRGVRAMRQDPNWGMKLLIAIVVTFIPVVGNIVITGWTALMLRRSVSGQDAPLPRFEFDFDYGMKLLQIGFKGFLVQLIWSLPLSLVGGLLGGCVSFGVMFSAGAMAQQNGGDPGPLPGLAFLCVMLALPIIILPFTLPLHIANLRAELTDDIKSGMDFKGVLGMTRVMWKELLVGTFVLQLLGLVAVAIGLASCYILLLPAVVVLRINYVYWLGQVYQRYLEKGGTPLPVGPLDVEAPAMGMPQRT